MLILENNGVFILETQNTHYVMDVDKEGVLTHLHWGKKCEIADYKATYTGNNDSSNHSARDICKTEYIPYGGIVYRPPAFMATFLDGRLFMASISVLPTIDPITSSVIMVLWNG